MSNERIIAVDFDGTLCDDKYPNIGQPIFVTMYLLKKEIAEGSKVILWTCRRGAYLNHAVEWCKKHGIEFDAVNENLPSVVSGFGGDGRKIFATEYWDDKAVKMPVEEDIDIF